MEMIINIDSMKIRVPILSVEPSNEAELLNPIIHLLNRLGFTVIAEPLTMEKNNLLMPDLVAFKRISKEDLVALIIEAKIRPQSNLGEQLAKYTRLLPEFTHILLVPTKTLKEALKIVKKLEDVCIAKFDTIDGRIELLECNLKIIKLTHALPHESTLAKLIKQYASTLHYGPHQQLLKLNKVLQASTPRDRAKKIEALMILVTRLPKAEKILEAAKQVDMAIRGSAALAKLLRKPFVSIMLHYIYNLSTAYVRDDNGFKQPIMYHICS